MSANNGWDARCYFHIFRNWNLCHPHCDCVWMSDCHAFISHKIMAKKIRFDRTFLSAPNSLKTYSSNSLKPALLKKLGEQTAADNGSYSALCPLWLWLQTLWSLAKLPQQWDHAAGCFDDFAHATFVARTQTFQTEAMGSKSVGEALPHTGSRSICQSHIGPTSDVALDAYAQSWAYASSAVKRWGRFYAYILQLLLRSSAMLKTTLPGCFRMMVMSMEQELSFTAFCGTKKPWDKAPWMRLPNSQHFCASKHNRPICGRYLLAVLELGFCRSGRMLLPPGPTETCWLDAAYGIFTLRPFKWWRIFDEPLVVRL